MWQSSCAPFVVVCKPQPTAPCAAYKRIGTFFAGILLDLSKKSTKIVNIFYSSLAQSVRAFDC